MTEQGERRINQPQCDPAGGKNTALSPVRGWGMGGTCNRAMLHHLLALLVVLLPAFFDRML